MSSSDLDRFLGVWSASPGPSMSDHTFTWTWDGGRLHGRWLVAMPDSPEARAAADAGKPTTLELPVGDAWLDDDVLLFRPDPAGFAMEFRLLGEDEAAVGIAVHKLDGSPEPDLARSIEGHRVKLRRSEADAD